MNIIPKDVRQKLDSSAAEIDPRFKHELKKSLFKEDTMSIRSSITKFLKYISKAPALAVFASIVLVGTASALVATNQTNSSRNAEIEVPANLDNVLTIDQIRAVVARDFPDASINGIEIENEHGTLLYKVKFADGSIRFYDAKTGNASTKTDDDTSESLPSSFQSGISLENARAIALDQRPGKTVTKIELETEEGVVVYSVRFSDGGRVDVNASNGNVTRVEGASNSQSSSDDSSSDDSNSSSSGSSDDSNDDDTSDSSGSGSGSDDDTSGSSNSGRGSRDN